MKQSFYLCAEKSLQIIIKEAFVGFEINITSIESINKSNLKNKNILLFFSKSPKLFFNESFYLNNNVVIFVSNNNNEKNIAKFNLKLFYGYTNINRFINEVTVFFTNKPFIFNYITIRDDKIINNKSQQSVFLTPIEKNILLTLFENVEIEKNYLLESVLKIRKDTETKTLESHLTRIRKKLFKVDIKTEILSKDNKIYVVN